jgi:hypothetical protein
MNIKNIINKDENLNKEIDRVLTLMSHANPTSAEYADLTESLSKLYALKESSSKNRLSKDTMAVVAGNLLGIVMIVGHEKAHVVTSKALGFVMKAR